MGVLLSAYVLLNFSKPLAEPKGQYFIAIFLFSAEQREKYCQYIDFSMMRWSWTFTDNYQ
jgi:hypothetical protein